MLYRIITHIYQPDNDLKHVSLDARKNSYSILCKGTSLRLANGRLHHDKHIESYTYCNKQGASVIDFLLLNENDFNHIKYFRINLFNEWSDHTPITF